MATHQLVSSLVTQTITASENIYTLDPTSFIFTVSGSALRVAVDAHGNELRIGGTLGSTTVDPVLDIDAEGTKVVIEKSGYLTGSTGILLSAASSDIVNRGHIDANTAGIHLQASAGSLVNYGEISAGFNGYAVEQSATAGAFHFENHGAITGFGGIVLQAPDITIILGKASEILTVDAIRVDSGAGDTTTVTNAGLISASAGYAFRGGNGVDDFTNRGAIYGIITLNGGNDRFTDKGKFEGVVTGGNGDDLFVVKSADTVINEAGAHGIDTVRTGVSYTLGSGIEHLVLTGGKNASLTGNGGANTLTGNGGNNRIEGGLEADILTGGGGRDLFLYAMLDGGDTITDFKQGQDRIRIEGFTLYDSFGDLDFEKSGKDVRISFIDENVTDFILVENQKIGDFDSGDFLFG
ncbi:calcium-binding protein [Rhizobium sp. LjRoot254]|uniref:calcium-binding protein n=1 Tax=Rhizobium sp. LjRoot254 TaxID=3342297 RepID=UPI003ECF4728